MKEQSWVAAEAAEYDGRGEGAEKPSSDIQDGGRTSVPPEMAPFEDASPEQVEEPLTVQSYERMLIGGGKAVMNNEILRSRAFSRPHLNTSLNVIAYRAKCSIELLGLAPNADHMDVLLYAVSLVEHAPSPGQSVDVIFTSHQFLTAFRWAVNAEGYFRLSAILQELQRIELLFHDGASPTRGTILLKGITASLDTSVGENELQRWIVSLPASLFRIYGLGRNSVIDLDARATLRSEFARWLHGFLSSQKPGLERRYDAELLCQAGGLRSARLTDDLKQLRQTLEALSTGQLLLRG